MIILPVSDVSCMPPATFDFSSAIALLSLFLSVGQIVVSVIRSRESYSVDVVDYKQPLSAIVQVLMVIENKSGRALTITEIMLEGVPCELEPKKIRGNEGKFGFCHTLEFPLCIPPHGCMYCYLEFLDIAGSTFPRIELSPGRGLNFEIRSTRRSVRKTVTLKDKSHYLHSTDQHRQMASSRPLQR